MSQARLAEATGVTRQTIIAIEQARYAPSLELAFRLSHVLSTPVEELFQFNPEWD
jgi:putative transcriptional regulator